MRKDDILKAIALDLWNDEAIDQANYSFSYAEFEKDFLKACHRHLDGIQLIIGKIIE